MQKFILLILLILYTHLFALDKKVYFDEMIQIEQKTKNYVKGIQLLEKAILEYPDEVNFYVNLVYFYSHAKMFEKSYDLAFKSLKKFPEHKDVKRSLVNSSIALGWKLYENNQKEKAYDYFLQAYKAESTYEWAINAYGTFLRDKKQVKESVEIFEKGFKDFPLNYYLKTNLSWSYLDFSNELLSKNQLDLAKIFAHKYFELSDQEKIVSWISYLNQLILIKDFDKAFLVLSQANKKYKSSEELLVPGYWVYRYYSNYLFVNKSYDKAILAFQEFFKYSLKIDRIWKDELSYQKLSLMEFHFALMEIMSELCPYYKRLNERQKETVYKYLSAIKRNLSPDLFFIYEQFKGWILYRENKLQEARIALDKSYNLYLNSRWGKEYKIKEIIIDFPLKGIYQVGNNESEYAVTHMGLQKFCYDIFGSDENGNLSKPGKDKNLLDNYFNYDAPIYSPVDGVIYSAEDGFQEDPISESATNPNGNYIQVLAEDKIYHFYHLKKGSVTFKKGDFVKKGQIIGRLGNSSSSQPHVHFGVFSKDMMVSLPVKFKQYSLMKNKKKNIVNNSRPGNKDKLEIIEVK